MAEHLASAGRFPTPSSSVVGQRNRSSRRIPGAAITLALLAGVGVTVGAPSASAVQPVPSHSQLATDLPRTNTPRITSGEIIDIEVVGSRVYLAGSFTTIANANGTSYAQPFLAAYNIDTGLVDTGFRPVISGTVEAVEASPDGSALYIGGNFNTVNGVSKRKVARINPATGATITTFTANAGARVTSLAVGTNWVYVGGQFNTMNGVSRSMLAAVNPTTGATDTGFNIPITQGIGSGGVLKVEQLQLTTDEATLLVVHTGRLVAGVERVAAALINTSNKSLRPWKTNLYSDYLPVVGGVVRVTNGDISPDGSYFVLVSGGGGDRPPVNDTAVAFPISPTTGAIDDVEPLWVSRHFDSLYAVAITEVAVYVAGHFRYQEAPTATQPWPGGDTTNYGWGESLGAGVLGPNEVVRRDMLGALDPATGTALDWNPGAEALLGHGHLEAIPRGLLLGIDGNYIGGQSIGRHAFFDWNNIPPPSAAETYIDYPFEGALTAGGVPLVVEGRATAVSGVSQVNITIQNTVSRAYMQADGSFSGTYRQLNAAVANPGQANSTFTFTTPINFPAGEYRVRARTRATNGTLDSTWAAKKFVSQVQDNPAPVTTVTFPTFGSVVNTATFTASGSSNDDSGISNVRIEIRNRDTQFYLQDNGTMAPQANFFNPELSNPGDPTVFWEQELISPPTGDYVMQAIATDNEGQTEHEGLGRFFSVVDPSNLPPAITLTSPLTGTTVAPNSTVQVVGTATDDVTVTRVEVSVRNNSTGYGVQVDGSWGPVPAFHTITPLNTNAQSVPFSYTTPPLPAGSYTIRVRATDNADLRTPTTATPPSTIAQPNVSLTVGVAGDALPDTLLAFSGSTQDVESLVLPISGTATDDRGVSIVKLTVFNSTTREYVTNTAGALSFANTQVDVPVATPGATSTSFAATFNLPKPGNYRITAVAVDTSGQYDGSSTGATATYLIFPGDADPTLVADLTAPDPDSTYTNFIPIGGRAQDDVSIARVNITVRQNSTGLYLRTDGTLGALQTLLAYLTNPGGAGSNFSYNTPNLPAGAYTVTIQPVDGNGQVMNPAYSAVTNVVAG